MRVPLRRRFAFAAATALAMVAGVAAIAVALPSSARISTAGLGPVKIGMTVAQVERAGRRDLSFDGGDANADCATAAMGSKLFGLFSKGRLARIYVASRAYATRTGSRVGDSETKVLASYRASLVRTPHKYVRGGSYLTLTVGNRRLVFETSARRRVTQISSGRKPEIDYVEGCA